MVQPKKKGAKKKEKKIVPSGVAHIQATFNNTLVTITDGCESRSGSGYADIGSQRQRAGFGAGFSHSCASNGRTRSASDPRRYADSAQRLSASEEEKGLKKA